MNKYRCAFVLSLESALEYRGDFLLGLISVAFPIIIQTYLWTAIYQSPEATVSNGYTYPQMILYTLLAGLISKLVSSGFEYEINQDIKNGGLNKFIVRPVDYLKYRFFAFLGEKAPASAVLLVLSAAMLTGASFILQTTIAWSRILLFLPALLFALLLNFLLFFCIAMLGFWFTEIAKLFGAISITLLVISGGVFPLDIFGDAVALITALLPFKYTTQFPVDLISGKLTAPAMLTGFLSQLFWLIVLFGLSSLLWKKGLKRYVAVGG